MAGLEPAVTVTVTDLFCGAGGSSLGAEVAGATIVLAANHWQTAIDVHQAHFPDARHDCADVSQVDPRRYPRTQVLIASPECTNHSQARGVSRRRQQASLFDGPDPAAERSRATMWDVVRFAEQMHYDAVVVENVVEVVKWLPFHGWWMAMESIGYTGRILSHNAMHHGVPQSRDRVFIVWTRKGLAPDLEFEQGAWCEHCAGQRTVRQGWKNGNTVGRYRQQWVWLCTTCGHRCETVTEPAARIIDWSLPCPPIGSRTKPLADATRERVLAGLQRYGYAPVTTSGAGNVHERTPGNRARSIWEPLPVQQTTLTTALATPPGFLVQPAHGGRLVSLEQPHPTVTASDDRHALVVPLRNHGAARPASAPLPAVTAGGNHHALLMRNNLGGAEMVTPVTEPARTITTAGHQSLLVPYYGTGQAQPVDRPMPTLRTRDTVALVDAAAYVDACGFRMLEPHEVAAAMAFPTGYIPADLTKRDRVKLAGNAVPPPVMTWIVGRLIQTLEAAA